MIYVFADCELDTCLYTLHRDGRLLRLRPKVYQVLTYLLLHRDRLVSKQELCEQIWSARAISDSAIENTVKAIRQATGDNGRTQQIIQTSYGYGYRFVAPVTVAPTTETDTEPLDDPRALPPAPFPQYLTFCQTVISPALFPSSVATAIPRSSLSQDRGSHMASGNTPPHQHEHIAQLLARQFPDLVATHPALLASHYTAAGRFVQAIVCWQQAGQRALERSAYPEAAVFFRQGLTLLHTLPSTPEQARQELLLQCRLALPLTAIGSALPEVEQAYSRALELSHQVGTPQDWGFVLLGLARLYDRQGAFGTARACAEQLLSVSQHLHDPALLLWSHATLGNILMRFGEFTAARQHLEQGLTYYAPQQHRLQTRQYGADPGLDCLGVLSWTLWYLGYPEQALQRSREAMKLAQTFAHPYSLGITLTYAAALHGLRQEWHLVQERAEALRQLATTYGFAKLLASATRYQGMALFWQNPLAGLARLDQGMAALQTLQAQEARAAQLAGLAGMYAHVGHLQAGVRLVQEAMTVAHHTGERYAEAPRYRTMGDLLRWQTPADGQQAEHCLQQALAIAQRQHAKGWELQAALSLSRLWQQQGKRPAAHELLAAVYARFTEGFTTPDLQQARVLLEQLA
jgi:DNA-binding winged helix-turn-helix (wHTH) protein/predicted ATPase